LVASAFVLAAMLIAVASQRYEPTAQAEMVVTKNVFTVLSATGVNANEEFLYMLDNKNARLLCYRHDARGRIELYGSLDVAGAIERGLNATGAGRDRRDR
jgi:hypothetical protein